MAEKITDHVDRALARLPQQFRGKTRLEALVSALCRPVQDIEDALWDLLTLRSVDTATGVTLESLGRLVGEPPSGLDVETYRRRIKARIKVNRSRGTTEDMIRIARLVLNDPSARLVVDRQGIAAIVFRVLGVVLDDDLLNTLISFLTAAAAGEGRVLLEALNATEEETFTLAIAAFASGALLAGATEIPVTSTAGFPSTGALDIDFGLDVAEQVTYSGITPTSFIGVSPLANAHDAGCAVQLADGPGKGLGDTEDSGVGGRMMDVRDNVRPHNSPPLIGGRLTSTLANLSLSAQGSVVDRATITQRLVVEGYSNDDLSTYSTAIGDPVDGEWHYIAVWTNGNDSTPPSPPSSIVGGGLNWQPFLASGWNIGSGNGIRNLTIWRAQAGASATAGTLSINYPSAVLGCAWVWCAFGGVASPTAVRQSDVDITSGGADPSVTLGAFEHAHNLFVAAYARSNNSFVAPPSGFTALGAQAPANGFVAIWVALGQTTCAPIGPGSGAAALHGLELVAGGV